MLQTQVILKTLMRTWQDLYLRIISRVSGMQAPHIVAHTST